MEHKIVTSVRISIPNHDVCKELDIKFSDALATGIEFILAEKGKIGYNPEWNITKKLERAMEKITEIGEDDIKRS